MQHLLTRLREFFSGTKPPIYSPALGLDERDIQLLRALKASEEWVALLKLLDVHISLQAEQLLAPQSRDASVLHELRGVIIGLRESALLVDKTLKIDDERITHQQRTAALAASQYDRVRATTFGTPAW